MLSGYHHLLSGRIKSHGAGAEDLRFGSELGFLFPSKCLSPTPGNGTFAPEGSRAGASVGWNMQWESPSMQFTAPDSS